MKTETSEPRGVGELPSRGERLRFQRQLVWGSAGESESARVDPYVRRVLELAPPAALVAFEQVGTEISRLGGRRYDVRLLEPAGRMARGSGTGDGVLARAPGVLRVGSATTISVELELLAWSSRRSELGLRPRGKGGRSPRLPRSYFDAAHGVMDELKAELEQWAVSSLRLET